MVTKLFPEGIAIFQGYNTPILVASVLSEWNKDHLSKVDHLIEPLQSPDHNIIENLLSILEKQIRNR